MTPSHLHTPEARAKAAAARSLTNRNTRTTTTPGSGTPGTPVRIRRSGDLTPYTGRTGWVAVVNTETYDNGCPPYTEIGVTFAIARDWKRASADAWFRTDELEERTA